MQRRQFLSHSAATSTAGAGRLSLGAAALARPEDLLVVSDACGLHSLDGHTVGARRPSGAASFSAAGPSREMNQPACHVAPRIPTMQPSRDVTMQKQVQGDHNRLHLQPDDPQFDQP
jgi:hypothetical protein